MAKIGFSQSNEDIEKQSEATEKKTKTKINLWTKNTDLRFSRKGVKCTAAERFILFGGSCSVLKSTLKGKIVFLKHN